MKTTNKKNKSKKIKLYWDTFGVAFCVTMVPLLVMISIILCNMECEYGKEIINFLGSIITITIGLFVYKIQKRTLPTIILERLCCEFKEINRHLGRNLEVLNSIKINNGIPSLMHIKKLKIDDHTTLTDNDTLKNINASCTKVIYPMTIRIRNYNITVEHLEKIIEEQNKNMIETYIEELKKITQKLQKTISQTIQKLENYDMDIEEDSKTPNIIYDKK